MRPIYCQRCSVHLPCLWHLRHLPQLVHTILAVPFGWHSKLKKLHNENNSLLERNFLLHGGPYHPPSSFKLQVLDRFLIIESFHNVFANDSVIDHLRSANHALEPPKLQSSCKVDDFVGHFFIAGGPGTTCR